MRNSVEAYEEILAVLIAQLNRDGNTPEMCDGIMQRMIYVADKLHEIESDKCKLKLKICYFNMFSKIGIGLVGTGLSILGSCLLMSCNRDQDGSGADE